MDDPPLCLDVDDRVAARRRGIQYIPRLGTRPKTRQYAMP